MTELVTLTAYTTSGGHTQWAWADSTNTSITTTPTIRCSGTGASGGHTAITTRYDDAYTGQLWTGWTTQHWLADTQRVWQQWRQDYETTLLQVEQVNQVEHRLNARALADARKVADVRARDLLESALSEAQRADLKRSRFFVVQGGFSKRRYRVWTEKGPHGNIEELDQAGAVVRRLCCAPSGGVPEGDAVLGQKLYLEHAEEEFVRTANVTDVKTGRVVRGREFVEGGGLLRAG